MKRIQLLLLAIVITEICTGQSFQGQKSILQVARYYFRSNPFDGEFSQFMNHLLHDPTLVNKIIHQRADSNFFYMTADYSTHNPFFFKAGRTKVVVAESEIIINDSLALTDTIITYQLAGYTPGGKEGEADVKKEFERFDRKYRKKFNEIDYTEIKNGNEVRGAIRNYFAFLNSLAPLSVAWQRIDSANENVFVITFRFRINDNMAVLPVYNIKQ